MCFIIALLLLFMLSRLDTARKMTNLLTTLLAVYGKSIHILRHVPLA